MPDLAPTLADSFIETEQRTSVLSLCDAFNTRCDSERVDMSVSATFSLIPGTPKNGAGILIIEGVHADQAAGIFIACKTSTNSGQVNELMQIAGTGNHAGEKYQVQWLDAKSLEVKTSGLNQSCHLKWRS